MGASFFGTQTLNRTQQQTEVKQPMEGFQEANLSKNRQLQIHLFRQNPWMQRDRVSRQMIRAFSVQVRDSSDHVALYRCNAVTHHRPHHLQKFAVRHGDCPAPLEYSFEQTAEANLQLVYGFLLAEAPL